MKRVTEQLSRSIVIGYLLLLIPFTAMAQAPTSWSIQEGYEVQFSGKRANGTFEGLEGKIHFDADQLTASSFEVSVSVSTIDTGNKTKDKHARGKKWFGAEAFPKIYFRSTTIEQTADGFLAKGELQIRGIKKRIDLPFNFTQTGDSGVFKGTMAVNRKDFDIMGNMFGFMVGDSFEVALTVPVQKSTGL